MTMANLSEIIASLQNAVRSGGVSKTLLEKSKSDLAELGYEYNEDRFPKLVGTETFKSSVGNEPSNLAEALLWKLGKWKDYKTFVANYAAADPKVTEKGVVFFAFAQHLKDKSNPIYDQHAIRALWAIDTRLNLEDSLECRSLLLDGDGKWKQAGSGKSAVGCYELFVKHVNTLVPEGGDGVLGEIDRLLMPLGQAIKKSATTYEAFRVLCGWTAAGHLARSNEA